jgi:hypothetical protein
MVKEAEMTSVPLDIGIFCGGARGGPACVQSVKEPTSGFADMKGSAYGEAFLDGIGRMRALWFSTFLIGDVPSVGRCVMHYEEEPDSTVEITAQSPTTNSFFPAQARQILYYRVSVVDDNGFIVRELNADRPVVMSAVIDAIPPLGTSFTVEEEVIFSDKATKEPILRLRGGSAGMVMEAPKIEIETRDLFVNSSTGEFRVQASLGDSPNALSNASLYWASSVHGAQLSNETQLLHKAEFHQPIELIGHFPLEVDEPRLLTLHAIALGPNGVFGEGHYATRF